MKYVIFIIILAVSKESHPLNPEILKYDQYMKDFEVTGRQMKQQTNDKKMGGPVMKRETDDENSEDSPLDSSDIKASFYSPKVENAFKKIYPDLDNLEPWPLAENLTTDFFKHICINVLIDVYPAHIPTIRILNEYVPVDQENLQSERVMRHTPVEFKEGVKKMTLLRCVQKDFEFFLARGDDDHVFKLEKDDKNDTYFFMTGPHAINFKEQI